MRLISTSILLLATLLLATTLAPAEPNNVGQYFCYVTKTAGISGPAGGGVAGQINLPEERKKFVITIEEIQRPPFKIEFCKKSVSGFLDALSRGERYQDNDTSDMQRYPREYIGGFCFAKDRLLLKRAGSSRTDEYFSYNGRFEFQGSTPDELFIFFNSGAFRRLEFFDSGTHAISEGQCEPIEIPRSGNQ